MHLRVNVVLVQLNVAVTDDKGKYVTGLRPEDFAITEDKLPQKISTFEESSDSGQTEMETSSRDKASPRRALKRARTESQPTATQRA